MRACSKVGRCTTRVAIVRLKRSSAIVPPPRAAAEVAVAAPASGAAAQAPPRSGGSRCPGRAAARAARAEVVCRLRRSRSGTPRPRRARRRRGRRTACRPRFRRVQVGVLEVVVRRSAGGVHGVAVEPAEVGIDGPFGDLGARPAARAGPSTARRARTARPEPRGPRSWMQIGRAAAGGAARRRRARAGATSERRQREAPRAPAAQGGADRLTQCLRAWTPPPAADSRRACAGRRQGARPSSAARRAARYVAGTPPSCAALRLDIGGRGETGSMPRRWSSGGESAAPERAVSVVPAWHEQGDQSASARGFSL